MIAAVSPLAADALAALSAAAADHGAVALAARAGVCLPTLYRALRGVPLSRRVRAALVAVLAREAPPRAA